MKKKSIKKKITQAFLIVCIAALVISAGVAVGILFNMRNMMARSGVAVGEAAADMSAYSITALVLNDMTALVSAKAESINWNLNEAVDNLRFLKTFVEALYGNPDAYSPAYIPNFKDVDEGVLSIHWFIDTDRLPDAEYNENDLLRLGLLDETYLLGNVTPFLDSMMDRRADIPTIFIQTKTGINVQYDTQAYLKAQVPEIPIMYERPWYVNARDTGGLCISDTYPDTAGRGLCVTISLPAYDKDGEFAAVVAFDFLIGDLSDTISETAVFENGYAILLGSDRVIAAQGLTEGSEYELPPFWDALSLSGSGITEAEINGESVYAVWDAVPLTGWKLACVLPMSDVIAPAEYAKNEIINMSHNLTDDAGEYIVLLITLLAGLFAVIMAAVIILSRTVAGKISAPIQKLSAGAERIGGGDLDYTFSVKTGDEIEELADAFNSMIASVKIITAENERIEMERADKAREAEIIREAHRNLQTVLDMLPVGVGIMSMNGFSVLYANQYLLDALGFTSPEIQMIGRSVFDLMPEIQPDGRKTADIVSENLRDNISSMELHCRKQNGELFSARVSFANISYEGAPVSLGVIEDMTAEENHRQMLQNIALREQEANQLKSRFLANMSHEIRTPMNAILGTAEIELQKETLPADTAEALLQIYESGDLLLNIINDILDLSKIEAGKLEIVPVKYDIPSLINDAAQVNRLRYESKPIDFLLDVDENTPLNLFGDELRIKQVLNNILSNAFKYTDEGEVKLSVWAEPASGRTLLPGAKPSASGDYEEDITLVFRVNDTGQGMTPEQIGKLFDEYTRFNLETNRTTVGTGLGMSITKRLTDLMNGEITVESEAGKGSVFTVRLPQQRVDSLVCGAEIAEKLRDARFRSATMAQKARIMREYMPYGSVLVVDDVVSNIYVTKGMLLPYGLEVDTASSGFEAIAKIKNGSAYDVIFMDHMMPRMNGIEATKKIRDMGYTASIVALTANALVGQAEMYLQNGFDGYLSKPIDSRELNRILNDFIRDKKSPDSAKAAEQERKKGRMDDTGASAREIPELKEFVLMDAENAVNVLEEIYAKMNNLDETDMTSYEITVHGMKSALLNIGEKELSDFALVLEDAGRNHDLGVIAEKTPAFIDALKALINKNNTG